MMDESSELEGRDGQLEPVEPSSVAFSRGRSESLSPDLVSLSSSESSEGALSYELSASQDDSDAIAPPSVPPNQADLSGRTPQLILAEEGSMNESRHQHAENFHTDSLGEQDNNSSRDTPPRLHSVTSSVQYQLVDKEKLKASEYESRGLLYAQALKARHNL